MALHYIIDGYNLVKHRSFAPKSNLHDPRFALIQFLRLEKPFGSLKNKVTIVFDGYSGGFSPGNFEFEVVFSCEASADERIKEMLESRAWPKNQVVVVSDDREIRDFSRLCGVTSLGIEEFLFPPKKKSPSREEDPSKTELSYNIIRKINEELKKKWLGK
jgi:hypothetical protein